MNSCKLIKQFTCTKILRQIIDHRQCYSTDVNHIVSEGTWKEPTDNAYNTGITVYNCVAKRNVPLMVRNRKQVTWYTCGPTVYDAAHIGHAVCYMKLDIIQRILRNYFHLDLVTSMNITDIDDKIIQRSNSENVPWLELAKKYEIEFWNDLNRLGIQRADIVLHVSESIPEIIDFIEVLIKKNVAYVAKDGSVYYRNTAMYGKLQNFSKEIAPSTETKESMNVRISPSDFALWKAAKPNEPFWLVPWQYDNDPNITTAGRPGWHTECSAMASKLFGKTIDIHAGGIDLRFPHHECEEAQCCSYHDTAQWINYWFHIGHLVTKDNVKMSKSLKNTISIKELLANCTRDEFRMVCLLTAYREHIQFDEQTIKNASNALNRLSSFLETTENYINYKEMQHTVNNANELFNEIECARNEIDASLKNDFDTANSIQILLKFVSKFNKMLMETAKMTNINSNCSTGVEVIHCAQTLVKRVLTIFGCNDTVSNASTKKYPVNENVAGQTNTYNANNLVNDIIKLRIQLRKLAKETKDQNLFEICTKLRVVLTNNGIEVKDHSKSDLTTWSFNDKFKTKS